MKKLFLTGLITLMLVSGAVAQGQAPNQTPDGEQPNKSVIPELPSDASPVAKQVRNTINNFLQGSIENLGNALQNLLGNGQASNTTEE